jgi:hypothetical protein
VALRLAAPGRSAARRHAMREVAERFPGALREWEQAPVEALRQRQRDAEAALASAALPRPPWPLWIALSVRVHRELGRALRAKRLLAGRPITAERADVADRQLGIDRASLEAIARPPAGRLSQLVHVQVAEAFGIPVSTLKAQLFPAGRSPAKGDEP